MEKQKKILIITTSGGSGHLQAAKAIEQSILEKDPMAIVIQKNLFLDWGFKSVCRPGINAYNKIQRVGGVRLKELMVNMLILSDFFFGPKFFFEVLVFLLKNDVDQIIDTQPVGTSAVIKAIRIYNKIKNKNLILEKVIVDLPTKRSTHFFNGIKRLSKKNKKFLKIISFEPLLEDVKTDEEFWQKYLKISRQNVIYEDYIVRSAFKKFKNKVLKDETFTIAIESKNNVETDLIKKYLKKTDTYYLLQDNRFTFSIGKNDKLITILLGSQPSLLATKEYVLKIIENMKNKKIENNYYLFVFLSDEYDLFRDILNKINEIDDFAKKLKIIPMSFQNDETIAALFFRSDITLTRSGGSTILELLSIANGTTLIHSESFDDLFKGIPYWEAGNALYLQDKKKAEIVNTENFSKYLFS